MVSNQGEKTGKKNHLLFQKTAQPLLHDQAGHLSPKSTPVIQLKPQPKKIIANFNGSCVHQYLENLLIKPIANNPISFSPDRKWLIASNIRDSITFWENLAYI